MKPCFLHEDSLLFDAGYLFMASEQTARPKPRKADIHTAEEVENAARSLPRSIMWSTYLNASLGFIMVITLIFTWGDMSEIAQTPTLYPFIQVFYNTTKSNAGTTVMALIVMLPLVGSVIACIAAASRQIWVRYS